MSKLILLRHGLSSWNERNLFTGWVDIPLSSKGIEESLRAGEALSHIPIDVIFVSSLMRAQMTAFLAMSRHKSNKVPVLIHAQGKECDWATHNAPPDEIIPTYAAWQLNERMYGALQGLHKQETMDKFGKEQVRLWRRSFAEAPPQGESLQMTVQRAVPYFQGAVMPHVMKGSNVLIVAHGNSLRGIAMFIERLSADEVVQLELETGQPRIYEWTNGVFTR